MTKGFVSLVMVLAIACGWATQAQGALEASQASQPFHAVIVVDICSARPDHLSGFGYARPTTPNLDAFMQDAAVFENTWAQSSWCRPNFATLLTGTRPEVHRQTHAEPSAASSLDALETLPEVLRQAGFSTAGFSGSRFLTAAYGLQRGFDTFQNPFNPQDPAMMDTASFEENLPAVREWLRTHRETPFFLYVTVDDLHVPYRADDPKLFDPEYHGVLDDASILHDMLVRLYNIAPARWEANPAADVAVQEFKSDPRHLHHLIARYDASLKRVDRLIGELFDAINQHGLWDKSLIIVTADHGEQFGEHGLFGHVEGLYEPILRIPLFVRYPGLAHGQRLPHLVERIDIPATILDTLGILADHPQFSGTSLMPLLTGQAASWKSYIFASSRRGDDPRDEATLRDDLAVRNARYKLLWHADSPHPYELYDLRGDPREEQNVAGSLPAVFHELRAQLEAYLAHAAVGPLPLHLSPSRMPHLLHGGASPSSPQPLMRKPVTPES